MYAQERHRQIIDLLEQEGRVAVAELANEFAVTAETIRRDLDQLEGAQLLMRVHGGAVPHRTAAIEPDLATRQTTNIQAKRRIALTARSLLPADPEAGVLLDAGTTTAQLIPHLSSRTGPVITNAPAIATEVLAHRGIDVHILPGRLRGSTHAAVGADTVESLRRLHPDIAFLGCNGITADGFTTPDPEEAAVKRAMTQQAVLRVVLADSSKAGTRRLVTFARPEEIDMLVTDSDLPTELEHELGQHGIDVIRA